MFHATTDLLGLPCWGVRRGYSSFLTLEFGNPSLFIREPFAATSESARVRRAFARRMVVVRGAWHLWVYCCDWRVESSGKTIGDSSTPRRIDRAARELDGQKLLGITLRPKGARTRFIFDLGAVLETRPYDRRSEQWMLYAPGNKVLSFRADRRYSFDPATQTESEHTWREQPGTSLTKRPGT